MRAATGARPALGLQLGPTRSGHNLRPVDEGQSVKSASGARLWLLGLGVAVLIGLAAGGGFALGHTGGRDLASARAKGAAVGHRAGTRAGAAEGRAIGGREGGQRGFEQTYDHYYRVAYRAAFEAAELDPPARIEVAR
jgi:hypothetical protein